MKLKGFLGKILAMSFLLTMFFQPFTDAKAGQAAGAVMSLSLEQSIEMALNNHLDIAIAKLEHEKAKIQLKQAISQAEAISEMRDQYSMGYEYSDYIAERIDPKITEMAEVLADKTLEFKKNWLTFQVEQAYYAVLNAEKQLQNAQSSLSRAKEQLRLAELGLALGIKGRADVLSAEGAVASQELSVADATNNLEKAKMDFNNLVGLEPDSGVKLIDNFTLSFEEFDLEQLKATAREKDITYTHLDENHKVQKEAFELAKGFYTPNVYAYQEAKTGYEIAALQLKKAGQELDLKIRKAYLRTETAKEKYKTANKHLEQAGENYRLAKSMYEAGMATFLDLDRARGELDTTGANLLASIYEYNLAAAMLKHGLFVE